MINLDLGATPEHIGDAVKGLSDAEIASVLYHWPNWARPEQLMPPGEWRTWILLGGRGSGKTRPGAEAIRQIMTDYPGIRVALIGPTSSDCRDVMIEGESGLLNCFPPEERPYYKPSRRLIQCRNGSVGFTYSAEEPERLRGPQHGAAWLDEIGTYPDLKALWDLMVPGIRLGTFTRRIATTTPRPLPFLHELLKDPTSRISRMRTKDNAANLPKETIEELYRIYGGTRIGRQELDGELLEEAEGALWTHSRIDALRVRPEDVPELARIVIPIDPSTTSGPDSDACGMVPVALGVNGHGYVLDDVTAVLSPDDWISRAVAQYDKWDADRIIGEANNGGDLIESLLRTQRKNISYEKVHASRGKITRAEPVAALYEQGKIHHVIGRNLKDLENEMCNYVPGMSKSPNRMDSLVWGVSYLMLKRMRVGGSHSI